MAKYLSFYCLSVAGGAPEPLPLPGAAVDCFAAVGVAVGVAVADVVDFVVFVVGAAVVAVAASAAGFADFVDSVVLAVAGVAVLAAVDSAKPGYCCGFC